MKDNRFSWPCTASAQRLEELLQFLPVLISLNLWLWDHNTEYSLNIQDEKGLIRVWFRGSEEKRAQIKELHPPTTQSPCRLMQEIYCGCWDDNWKTGQTQAVPVLHWPQQGLGIYVPLQTPVRTAAVLKALLENRARGHIRSVAA